MLRYVVQSGDAIPSIALHYRTTSSAIAALNYLSDPAHLLVGEVISVPVGYQDTVELPPIYPAAALLAWDRLATYTVRPGDSLDILAANFLTSSRAIALFNDLDPAADLPPGETLHIPWGFTLDLGGVSALFTP